MNINEMIRNKIVTTRVITNEEATANLTVRADENNDTLIVIKHVQDGEYEGIGKSGCAYYESAYGYDLLKDPEVDTSRKYCLLKVSTSQDRDTEIVHEYFDDYVSAKAEARKQLLAQPFDPELKSCRYTWHIARIVVGV